MLDIMRENASGWIVKILFAIIIIVFVFAFGMSGLDTSNDPVLATVNDRIITRAEFEDAFQRAAEGLRKANPNVTSAQLQDPQFKQLVLNELINSRLLLEEAERLGISASDEEVFAAITRQSIFWNAEDKFDRNIYQAALRSIRMTPAQFEANFRNEYIAGKVKDMVRSTGNATEEQTRELYNWVGEEVTIDYIETSPRQFVDAIDVTDEEIRQFYTENESRFMVPEQASIRYLTFTPKALATYQEVTDEEIKAYYDANADNLVQREEVNARHILVMTKDSDTESVQKEARNKIDRIYKKAKAGEDFAELAKTYSEGPSASNGGALGWFGRGAMVPEFEEAAFATPKGEVSEPIKTQFGWHIIYVDDRKDPESKSLEYVKDQIAQAIAEEKAAEVISDMLDQSMDRLVSGMDLEAIADELGLLAVTSRPMPESSLPQAFGMTPEAAQVIMAIPAGEAHQTPLAIDGGYMLLEKVEDIPAAPMELDQVKQVIINAITTEKATEKAKAAADEILAKLSSPEGAKELADRIKTSEQFSRQGVVPGLGRNVKLAKAVFDSDGTTWLSESYVMPSGSIIVAKLHERIAAPEEMWEQQKDTWIEQASRNYQTEALTAFMTDLRKEANIVIARPDLLN
ncbi:Peptidylprolyl isomerase [Pseudodesulfovibrio profundus]|uniref:Periplasmic chaperone PpiD n=1 Tax=Pseudodesulfovibrio profundus TaxID=57320 RepID=A0A2C8F8R1_9BACT|nr:SurA N-terminal domain-containing protein [Pseudodesulfovibrio profundus]SOB58539.1 Peptidylprolyl isomerase [Pseudodesulfovibrio profundus]